MSEKNNCVKSTIKFFKNLYDALHETKCVCLYNLTL